MKDEKLIEEYSETYCLMLESAYGKDMMSEGGVDAIEKMFKGISLSQHKILEIGFGLGGVAFHLAEKYQAYVTGLEISPWMVNEVNRRTPLHLRQFLNFFLYEDTDKLSFDSLCFDIVYSKGVLTHLASKQSLFQELYRVLKPEGNWS